MSKHCHIQDFGLLFLNTLGLSCDYASCIYLPFFFCFPTARYVSVAPRPYGTADGLIAVSATNSEF